MSSNQLKIRKLTQLSLLIAVEIVMAFTPFGLIMIPPISITLLHIPIIIAGIVIGTSGGAILGGVFGIISIYKATTAAVSPVDIAFSPFLSGNPVASILMAFVARVLLGVFAALIFKALSKVIKKPAISSAVTAALATILHSLMVLSCLAIFFSDLGMGVVTIFMTLVSINGILETLAAVLATSAITLPLLKSMKR